MKITRRHKVTVCVISLLFALSMAERENQRGSDRDTIQVEGWSAAHWGMSATQVRAAFPKGRVLDIEPPDAYTGSWVAPLGIPEVDVQGVKMRVRFVFSDSTASAQLVSVNLESLTKSDATAIEYGTITQALIEKYGEPAHRRVMASGTVQSTTWVLAKTVIRISNASIGNKNLLTLSYQQRLDDPNL